MNFFKGCSHSQTVIKWPVLVVVVVVTPFSVKLVSSRNELLLIIASKAVYNIDSYGAGTFE